MVLKYCLIFHCPNPVFLVDVQYYCIISYYTTTWHNFHILFWFSQSIEKKQKYIDFCQGFINGKLEKQLIVPKGHHILLLTNGKMSTGLSLVICIVCLTDMLSKVRHSWLLSHVDLITANKDLNGWKHPGIVRRDNAQFITLVPKFFFNNAFISVGLTTFGFSLVGLLS